MMSDTVGAVKERLDIVDFIRQYVALAPAGKNVKGLCPFHKEKTPSFIVSPDRQVWHCFGCGKGGDMISFLMQYENIEFFEALKILAEKAGIDVRTVGGTDQRQFAVLYEINNVAKEFFKNNLNAATAVAESARNYLRERGLKPETIQEFEIGLAPNASDALSKHLLKLGYAVSEIERAGLIFKTERGTYWDRFRHRIMFPLWNAFGKTVAFTGRLMPGAEETEAGKYVNSPETPIFQKSKLLFGFNKAKNAIRDARSAVLLEGQMDLIMVWQDGVKNAIATSGTALTGEHLRQVRRLADSVIISFDNDEAGQAATERAIDLSNASDFSVKILRAPKEFKDPADLVKAKPGAMASLIIEAKPAMQFYFERYIQPVAASYGGVRDIANLKKSVRVVLGKIKAISSPVEQAHWMKELSEMTRIGESHLLEEMKAVQLPRAILPAGNQETEMKQEETKDDFSRQDLIAQRFISLALADSGYKQIVKENEHYLPEAYKQVARALLEGEQALSLPAELKGVAELVSLRSSLEVLEPSLAALEFQELLRHLKLEYYKDQRQILGLRIRAAEQSGDEAGLREALKEFDRISRETYNT